MPDLNAPNFGQPTGDTQMALQAPTDLQRQLDNYVANWNSQNNAPFSYAAPGQLLPIAQGGPMQPPPLGLEWRPLATNQNLFLPSSIFSPTFNATGTGTVQVGASGTNNNGFNGNFGFNGTPTLGGAPGSPMLGGGLTLGGISVGGGAPAQFV